MGDELKLPPGATLVSQSSIGDQSIALPPGATLVSDAPDNTPPEKPGAGKRFVQAFGVPTSQQESGGVISDIAAHPDELLTGAGGVAKKIVRNYGDTVQGNFQDYKSSLRDLATDVSAGRVSPMDAIKQMGVLASEQGIKDIPFFGNTLWNYGSDIQQKNYAGAAGGGLALAAQILGPKAAESIGGAIPSKAAATDLFKAADAAASKVPIDLSAPGNIALDIQKAAQSGGRAPKVITDFVKRTTDPEKGPLTYTEAREFYSNATRLSADESMSLTPAMKMRLGQFTKSLGDSIAGAADKAGVLPQYLDAMRQYRQASRLDSAMDVIKDKGKDALVKGALQGAGAAGASYGIYKMIDAFKNR